MLIKKCECRNIYVELTFADSVHKFRRVSYK